MTQRHAHFPLPDLSGVRALVTGATDGMGLRIATKLGGAGAAVVMPARNEQKAAKARDDILALHPEADVSIESLDLASLTSIRALGERLKAQGLPLHIMINNAGLMTPPTRQLTQDGFELQFGTNFLGHVALVAELMDVLIAGKARVTSQVSIAAQRGKVLWEDPQSSHDYNAMAAYSHSKIALGLFAIELHRQSALHGWGLTSNLSHPGVAPTNLLAAQPGYGRQRPTPQIRMIRALSRLGIAGTAESAALPALMAATTGNQNPVLYGPSGLGHISGAPGRQAMYPSLQSLEDQKRIWDLAATELNATAVGWSGFATLTN